MNCIWIYQKNREKSWTSIWKKSSSPLLRFFQNKILKGFIGHLRNVSQSGFSPGGKCWRCQLQNSHQIYHTYLFSCSVGKWWTDVSGGLPCLQEVSSCSLFCGPIFSSGFPLCSTESSEVLCLMPVMNHLNT